MTTSEFEPKSTRLVNKLSEDFINRIENIFEQWNDERRKLNDCLDYIEPWKEFIPSEWFNLTKKKLYDFNDEELKLKCQLSHLLDKIRSSKAEESETIKLISDFNQQLSSSKLIENFFEKSNRIMAKIKTLKRISPKKRELLTYIDSIEDFIQDFYDDDLYFLHICEQWQKDDKEKENSFKQIRYFINLKNTEQDAQNNKAKFWVIDLDLHVHLKDKPKNSVIYYATSGSIKSKDFYKYSLRTLLPKEVELILNKYSNLTEQCVIDRHEQFIKDHTDGELSKDDFIGEFQKLFPEGNPKKFCEFAFPTIDKNKYGKINFSEFMTAVALTHPGDTETRLHLVFSVCDYNYSGTIDTRKIVKFIEVIAELNNGPSAVDTSAAKSIAEQIMNMCNKNKDGTVTENEFIDCCKGRIKIAMAFLPNLEMFGELFPKLKCLNLEMFDTETWKQDGITVAGGNGQGNQLNQLYFPFGMFLDDDQTIYIADWCNHRIVEWTCNATNGQIVAGGNGEGNQTNQLNYPINVIIDKKNSSFIISDPKNRRVIQWSRHDNTIDAEIIIKDIDCWGLTMDKDGSLYVSDYKKNEVRRWKGGDENGTRITGDHKEGNHPNQLNYPTYIFVDNDYSLYVSDVGNHRVMKWLKDAKEGIVVAGGNGNGNSLTQLSYPRGLIVDQLGQIYVADSNNHRVMRWCKGAKEGTIVVGGNGKGEQSNQLNAPQGLSSDRQGNLYVVDRLNNRIQKFEIN